MNVPYASLLLSLLAGGPDQPSLSDPVEVAPEIDSAKPQPSQAAMASAPACALLAEAQLEELDSNGIEELTEALAALGPTLLGEARLLLASSSFSSGEVLTTEQLQVLRAAVARLGRTTVLQHLETTSTELEQDAAGRRGALALLAPVAEREDLELALKLSGAGVNEVIDASLRQPLFATISELLANDPGAHQDIPARVALLDPTAASPLVRAVGEASTVDAWETLESLLGSSDRLDRITLASIGQLAKRAPGTAPEPLVYRITDYLGDADFGLVRSALSALAAVDCQDQHEELIELLSHTEEAVRSDAHSTLVAVTGLGLPADAERWGQWLEEEKRWWLTEAPDLFREIEGGELSEMRAALRALSRHRLRRDEIAERMFVHLERRSPSLRIEACEALALLGAKVSVTPLRDLYEMLEPGDPARAAARSALEQLGALRPEEAQEDAGSAPTPDLDPVPAPGAGSESPTVEDTQSPDED